MRPQKICAHKVTTGVNKQGNYLPVTALLGDYIRNVIAELKL